MKISLFFFFVSLVIFARGTSAAIPAATKAAGSFHLGIDKGGKFDSCAAVRLANHKPEQCFAVTARKCFVDHEPIGGGTTVRSAELGEHTVHYFVTPGDAVLVWRKCTGNEHNLPAFYLLDY